MIFVNKYGFVCVINFLMICEKHSYLQLFIKLAIWSLILNPNTNAVNNFIKYGSIVFVLVTNSFSDTPQQFYCNNMKMERILNIMW